MFVSRSTAAPPELQIRVTGDRGAASLVVDPDTGTGVLSVDGRALPALEGSDNPYAVWLGAGRGSDSCATLADGARVQGILDEIVASAGALTSVELERA
jgi:hypothetical protein